MITSEMTLKLNHVIITKILWSIVPWPSDIKPSSSSMRTVTIFGYSPKSCVNSRKVGNWLATINGRSLD